MLSKYQVYCHTIKYKQNIIDLFYTPHYWYNNQKKATFMPALIKQHKIVFGKRRSFGYAVSPIDRS